jgi:DegV family protein with EDD domain
MQSVSVITDSVSCLPPEIIQRYQIGIVPLNIISHGRAYRDGIDISPTQAYELFLENPDTFSTSSPSPAEFLKAYKEAAELAETILYISLSARISSTYETAILAREYAKKEMPGKNIQIMDSASATTSEGFIAYAAAKASDSGASFEEVMNIANDVKRKVDSYVLLDTVKHVYRSGRVPKVAAQAGSFFNIRALFEVREKIRVTAVVRNRKRGLDTMFEKIKSQVGTKPIHAAVMHAYAPDAAISLKERTVGELNCRELWVTEFSPIMGYACGTGTLGIAFCPA